MKKELDFIYPLVSTYTQHAHLFGILGTKSETSNWIYSNYIQVYVNKDLNVHDWGDFYFPMPYETRPVDACKWIINQKLTSGFIKKHFGSIVAYIIKCINDGYYVNLAINYRYVGASFANKNASDLIHDPLVIGYDDEKRVFRCADFVYYSSYKYEIFDCSFDDMETSYNDAVESLTDNNVVYGYRLKDSIDYEFSFQNIIYGLKGYLNASSPEYWEGYNYSNKKNIVFGVDFYTALYQYLEKYKPEDIPDFLEYLMVDHKKLMIERIKFLNLEINGLEEFVRGYEKIYENVRMILNLSLKYYITNKMSLLDKVIEQLKLIQKEERELLIRLIDRLEDYMQNH